MEEMKWPEKVTNEQVLARISENRTLQITSCVEKPIGVGHFLRRNCLLHDANEKRLTKLRGVGRRIRKIRRRTQLLEDLRNTKIDWELKEEAEVQNIWKRQFTSRI